MFRADSDGKRLLICDRSGVAMDWSLTEFKKNAPF